MPRPRDVRGGASQAEEIELLKVARAALNAAPAQALTLVSRHAAVFPHSVLSRHPWQGLPGRLRDYDVACSSELETRDLADKLARVVTRRAASSEALETTGV